MPLHAGRLVGEVAATIPEAVDAFRVAGVDCCRDARLTLEQAAVRTGVRSDRLIALMRGRAPFPSLTVDWWNAPLRTLTRHVAEAIHPTSIASMEALSTRLAQIARDNPNEWLIGCVRSAFAEVANNLVIHVWRVENEIFPLLDQLEETRGGTARPLSIDELPDPHDPMLEGLRDLRTVTGEYSMAQPEGLAGLLPDLRAFDDALHRHIHLEHHVLYPRAAALCGTPQGTAEPTPVLAWV